MSKQSLMYFIAVLLAAVFLLTAVFTGIAAGQGRAAARVVLANAATVGEGLDFFYSDHGRFPTANEFASPELMRSYFSNFPPQEFTSEICPENFAYRRPNSQSYSLSFCLERSVGGMPAGWNSLQASKR